MTIDEWVDHFRNQERLILFIRQGQATRSYQEEKKKRSKEGDTEAKKTNKQRER